MAWFRKLRLFSAAMMVVGRQVWSLLRDGVKIRVNIAAEDYHGPDDMITRVAR